MTDESIKTACAGDDPYVEEVRSVRSRLNEAANYDLAALSRNVSEFVRSLGVRYCALKPLKPQFAQ